jgi:hypothetical protein
MSANRAYGYMRCPCCGGRRRVYVGEVWCRRDGTASIKVLDPDRDGAIVMQVERPQDPPFALSYRELRMGFTKEVVRP